MKARDLFEKFLKWTKEVVTQKRLDNKELGYDWVYKTLEFDKDLKIKEYQEFFDRKELNNKYKTRYEEKSPPDKKPYCWVQQEIDLIYSFHKCFAMRNQTRLQHYRHDLSQKGERTRSTTFASLGKFEFQKERGEEKE
jgi:hypothetical protein